MSPETCEHGIRDLRADYGNGWHAVSCARCGLVSHRVKTLGLALASFRAADARLQEQLYDERHTFQIADWKESDGDVLWWRFPLDESPYCGTPLDQDWPGYHTHWTRIPRVSNPEEP